MNPATVACSGLCTSWPVTPCVPAVTTSSRTPDSRSAPASACTRASRLWKPISWAVVASSAVVAGSPSSAQAWMTRSGTPVAASSAS
ncbi:hypothetical protein AB0J43_57260 [Nonomuraea fuscirosea]